MWRDLGITYQEWERTSLSVRSLLISLRQQVRLLEIRHSAYEKQLASLREQVATLYVTRTGCAWSYLPRDYPLWQTVYGYFRTWRALGRWKRLHDRLRSLVRKQEGREPQPTAAILDSQSVKTTERGGSERGYDAGKKTFGRKRHILVDTIGLLLLVIVHSAGTPDRDEE